MDSTGFYRVLSFMLLFIIHSASAFDAGDAIALVIGILLGLLGLCACIGFYAKRSSK